MNALESYFITTPDGKTGECGKFVIDDLNQAFVLSNIMTVGRKYSFSFWVRSDSDCSVLAAGTIFSSSTEWSYHTTTFEAMTSDLRIHFFAAGTYYIYHPQLELGTIASDYAPAAEDLEADLKDYANATYPTKEDLETSLSEHASSLIQQLNDLIKMVVTDASGESMMEQTADGWTFSMASIQSSLDQVSQNLDALNNELGNTNDTVGVLSNTVGTLSEYVKITVYEDEPCIELGEGDSDFKLLITNTRIMFMEGSNVPTYISNNTLVTNKIRVETEIQQGDFVWARRANGNLGLAWKEVSG